VSLGAHVMQAMRDDLSSVGAGIGAQKKIFSAVYQKKFNLIL
jgi:hypothetical protein